jgi:hypothetical protein
MSWWPTVRTQDLNAYGVGEDLPVQVVHTMATYELTEQVRTEMYAGPAQGQPWSFTPGVRPMTSVGY